jgi:hypothetical protein
MALAGEKVGIPSADEAPLIVVARYKQPIAGLLAIMLVFIICLATWWLLFDPRLFGLNLPLIAALIGGFGLIGVLWAIWFENWPYYNKFHTPWKVGLVGTIINLVIVFVFLYLLTPLFTSIYTSILGISDPMIATYIGQAIFGPLSASCFSFAVLFVAGTMYWPFFKYRQPKRGILVWIIGSIITIVVWVALFLFTANPAATTIFDAVTSFYGVSMAWTQWLIFFSLLTLMVFEYWPWNKLATKQPKIGIYALIGCAALGFLISYIFPYIVAIIFDPIFVFFGGAPPGDPTLRLTSWGVMSVSFADFLIAAIILVSLFFDNWPKRYTQRKNFIFRFGLVIIIGILGFFGYYFLGFWLIGDGASPTDYFFMVPTHFLLWFLWIELLFAYVWRKWPIYVAVA